MLKHRGTMLPQVYSHLNTFVMSKHYKSPDVLFELCVTWCVNIKHSQLCIRQMYRTIHMFYQRKDPGRLGRHGIDRPLAAREARGTGSPRVPTVVRKYRVYKFENYKLLPGGWTRAARWPGTTAPCSTRWRGR